MMISYQYILFRFFCKVIMKGTREQVDRAYLCIENLIERNVSDKLSTKQRYAQIKRKEK